MKTEFPSSFYYDHPIGLEDMPQSFYITDARFLDSPGFEELHFPGNYRAFFEDPGKMIGELTGSSKSKEFSQWLKKLAEKTIILERHFHEGQELPSYGIQFTDLRYYNEWKAQWPSFGITVVLDDGQDLSQLPEPLREIYRFGQIYLYSTCASGNFLPPAEIIPIARMKEPGYDAEYLRETAREYQRRSDASLDLNNLRPFYVDSGTYLLFDKNESVWIGGIEGGDLYGTDYKLQETLDKLFGLLQVQSIVSIGEIIPEKSWKEKN